MNTNTCNRFALELLRSLAVYDIEKVKSMFEQVEGDLPIEAQFPKPEGFSYQALASESELISHVVNDRGDQIEYDFEMPFEGDDFRPMMIRTIFINNGEKFSVTLTGVVPT